jgi:hypothetical protein
MIEQNVDRHDYMKPASPTGLHLWQKIEAIAAQQNTTAGKLMEFYLAGNIGVFVEATAAEEAVRLIRHFRHEPLEGMENAEFICPNGCDGTFLVNVTVPRQEIDCEGKYTVGTIVTVGAFMDLEDEDLMECRVCDYEGQVKEFRAKSL